MDNSEKYLQQKLQQKIGETEFHFTEEHWDKMKDLMSRQAAANSTPSKAFLNKFVIGALTSAVIATGVYFFLAQ